MKRIFQVTKKGGQVINKTACTSTLEQWLTFMGNGTYVLTLTRKQDKRSVSQNRLMWLRFTVIAEAWSEAAGRTFTPQEVHDAYCIMFLPKEAPNGMRYAGSTSGLTTEQMTIFLDQVQADAQTEYGITLPNPDDLQFEAWAEQYNNQ